MLRRTLLLCVLLLATLTASAQAPTPPNSAPSPLPADRSNPDAFMRQAADAMSLTAPGMKPFHLHAKDSEFGPGGILQRAGTIELWWRDADHYKATYTGSGLTRTEYRSGGDAFFTGSPSRPGFAASFLIHPLPGNVRLAAVTFTAKDLSVGQNKLQCFTENPTEKGPGSELATTYCFDPTFPLLRMTVDSFGQRVLFNGLARVNGHYFAKQIKVSTRTADPRWTIDVENIDPQAQIADQDLNPPTDATRSKNVDLLPEVAAGEKISGEDPVYPSIALSTHAAGNVTVNATIMKDGSVGEVTVVNGSQLLVPAVLKAVKTWKYHPFTLEGAPVECKMSLVVAFAFQPVN